MDITALQIDPEFRSQIPPLKDDEFAQLRENILADGEVYEPIAVCQLPKMETEAVAEIADAIVSGAPIPQLQRKSRLPRSATQAEREDRAMLDANVADMYDRSTVPEYTVDCLIDEIRNCSDEFVFSLRATLADRSKVLTDENRPKVAEAINLYIINEIGKVRDLL